MSVFCKRQVYAAKQRKQSVYPQGAGEPRGYARDDWQEQETASARTEPRKDFMTRKAAENASRSGGEERQMRNLGNSIGPNGAPEGFYDAKSGRKCFQIWGRREADAELRKERKE